MSYLIPNYTPCIQIRRCRRFGTAEMKLYIDYNNINIIQDLTWFQNANVSFWGFVEKKKQALAIQSSPIRNNDLVDLSFKRKVTKKKKTL